MNSQRRAKQTNAKAWPNEKTAVSAVNISTMKRNQNIQLFRERLSYKLGKASATMSKVIMGNGGFSCFSVVEGNITNTCIHSFSILVAESP